MGRRNSAALAHQKIVDPAAVAAPGSAATAAHTTATGTHYAEQVFGSEVLDIDVVGLSDHG